MIDDKTMEKAKEVLDAVLLMGDMTKAEIEDPKVKSLFDDDDDLNEPLGERCLIDDPECESCQ